MSDYKTSITDLYTLKSALQKLKVEQAQILKQLAISETRGLRKRLEVIGRARASKMLNSLAFSHFGVPSWQL